MQTVQEIMKEVLSLYVQSEDFFDETGDELENIQNGVFTENVISGFTWGLKDPKFGKYNVELAEKVGGEGEGEHFHVVFKLKDENGTVCYAKINGFYSSYNGVNYESQEFVEVYSTEVKVTRFLSDQELADLPKE